MKRICGIAFITTLSIAIPSIVNACEITVAVEGVQKEKYKTGDIVVLKIIVVLQHRNCDVSLDQTDINVSGSQIKAATKWATTDGKTWERKIRIKIVDDKTGKAIITAERTCEKDGGKGSLTLLTVS
jgi:hypothetical protein